MEIDPAHSPGQNQLIWSRENDVVFAGRRWGKTHAGVHREFSASVQNSKALYWWVALSYRSASARWAWRQLRDIHHRVWAAKGIDPVKRRNLTNYELAFPNGSEIWMRSSDRPESLAGAGIDGVILDEFSLMNQMVWHEYVSGTLIDKKGWAMFIGVPKGVNWAATMYRNTKERKGWNSWHFTTYDNPGLDQAEIDERKRDTPSNIFEQEYMAQILTNQGAVFRGVNDAIRSSWLAEGEKEDPEDRSENPKMKYYIAGMDVGKLHDYSVVTIIDADTKDVVHVDRFNAMQYTQQVRRVKRLADKFQLKAIVVEANMGEAVIDMMLEANMPVRRFTTTQSSKMDMIERLQVAIENQSIGLLPDDNLINELLTFEARPTASGMKYEAPSGCHDDCVMSLALAWDELSHGTGITF